VEACQQIIEMARPKLEPSKLALRKGETAESTKDTRTRYYFEQTLLLSSIVIYVV